MGSRATLSGLQYQLLFLLAMWSWAWGLTPLVLSFLVYKVGLIIIPHGLFVEN